MSWKTAALSLCLWVTAQISANAQDSPKEGFQPLTIVSLSLIDGIDPFSPACLLSLEIPVAPQWGIKAEGGYVSTFDGTWVSRFPMRGHKWRLEGRWYIEDVQKDNFYLGLQAMYKRTSSDRTDTFCRQGCQFTQELDYEQKKEAFALHGSLGGILFLSKHFIFDIGGTFGLRHVRRFRTGIPDDAMLRWNGGLFTFTQEGTYWAPSIGLTFRAGFAM